MDYSMISIDFSSNKTNMHTLYVSESESVCIHTLCEWLFIVWPRPRQPDFNVNIIITNKMQKRLQSHSHTQTHPNAHTRNQIKANIRAEHGRRQPPAKWFKWKCVEKQIILHFTNTQCTTACYTIASAPMFRSKSPNYTTKCIFWQLETIEVYSRSAAFMLMCFAVLLLKSNIILSKHEHK